MAFPTETVLLAGTKCMVGILAPNSRVPASYNITNGAGAEAVTVGGAGVLDVTATPIFIQEGTELSFAGGAKIRVTADSPDGDTTIPYVGIAAGNIAAGAVAPTKALLRIFGGNSADVSYNDNEVSTRSFESGLYDDARKVMVGSSIAWQGTYRVGDRGFDTIILQKANTADEVYVEFTYPDGSVFQGAAFIMNLQLSGALDNIRQVSWTFRVVGKFDFTPGLDYD